MGLSICPSPSFTMSCFPAEEARELCCSAVSAVITKLFYAIFIFLFAVVGATLGALIGAFVGAKTKIGCLHGATIGAIKGTFFSIKLFTISLIVYSSDDMATTCLQQPINAFVSTLNKAPWNKRLSEDSTETIPKIRITEENVWDSSRNRISCSICLQTKSWTLENGKLTPAPASAIYKSGRINHRQSSIQVVQVNESYTRISYTRNFEICT